VQHKSKKYEPYRISTYAAEQTVKAAAKDKKSNSLTKFSTLT